MSELRDPQPPASALPPLKWEEKTWEGGHLGVFGRAAERLSHRGRTYQAAVPPLISGLEIKLDGEVALFAREAELELTRFDAEANGRLGAFGPVLLRSEAASSSQIESLTASARQIFTAEAAGKGSKDASEIAANSRAMIEAIELADRLSVDAIRQMHRELMSGQGRHTPGEFRTEPVWIGTRADSPIGASYVAPDHGRIFGLMTDLIGYVSREDLPPLEQVAIAHAQFETIHPFSDGNGRTGRALAQAMLRHSRVTRNVVVPVSAGLLTNVDGYHQALTDYQAGDPNTIVHAFAAASMRAVPNGRQLIGDLDEIAAGWEEEQRPRPGSIKKKILDLALTCPVFTAENMAQQLGIPPSNIYRYLKELQDAGVLAMKAEYQGPRIWRAPSVLAVVDSFADRAGRRT